MGQIKPISAALGQKIVLILIELILFTLTLF